MGEQDLGSADAVRCERVFVCLGDAGLPDGGGGLQFVDGGGAFAPAQPFDAFGDGAAGNEDGLHALFAQFGDLRRPAVECGLVYAFAACGNEAGADFDDEESDLGQVVDAHGFSFYIKLLFISGYCLSRSCQKYRQTKPGKAATRKRQTVTA